MTGTQKTEPESPATVAVAAPATSRPRPLRMRPRLSVRGLLFVIVVIACGLAWVARVIRTGEDQRRHVAAIYRAGGWVVYDSEWTDDSLAAILKPKWPKWMVDSLGHDYFDNVVFVNLHDRGNDAVMADVGRLSHLKQISRTGPHVSDVGIAHLRKLGSLQLLSLRNSQVTDAGIEQLMSMTSLKWLNLSKTKVSDAGASQLERALPHLKITR